MEGLVLLVLSLVGLVVFAAPALSIVGFLRARAMRARLDELTRTVAALERTVGELSDRATPSTGPQAPASPVRPPVATPPPVTPPVPTAVAPSAQPASTAPLPPPPPPSSAASPSPAPSRPPAPADPPAPPRPPQPPATPVPPAPSFDWESLLGVRGAAWLGGVTLVIAALFFAKWSVDQGFFSPAIRISLMLLSGTAALVWAEVNLRQGYQPSANAVSGAGVVTLYGAFFAGHSLYDLFSLPVAFGAMSVVTLAAAVIAVRHGAFFTAVIGLAGGMATPILLSTGVDRPVAFFSYLTLLTAGFLWVAERRAWPFITMLALTGTTVLQVGWHVANIVPEKLAVAALAYAALGAAYLWHAIRTRETGPVLAHRGGIAGSLVPLGLGLLLAADGRFVAEWAGVAAFLVALDVVLVSAALKWHEPVLVGVSAVATGLAMHLLGGTHAAFPDGLWGLTAGVAVLTIGYNVLPRLADRWQADWVNENHPLALFSGVVTLLGLLAFAWLAGEGRHLPVWAFLGLTACALWVVVERTREGRWPGTFGAGAVLVAVSSAHWVTVAGTPDTYLDHLTVPHLVATVVAVIAAWRKTRPAQDPPEWWHTEYAAVVGAASVAYWSAVGGLDVSAAPAPAAYFGLVALDVALVVGVAVRASWAGLVPAAAAGALVFAAAWHGRHFAPPAEIASVAAYVLIYVVFLALPFVVSRRLDRSWSVRPAPWLASALVGPASFPLFYDSWVQLAGRAWVGVVPVVMAAVSVAALYGVGRVFASSSDEEDAQRRLNYLALFAAIALGFIATAVPLQVERQWITLGWALEAAAVWWLFGLLPHPGLKYFGLALYVAVGARLLVNPEVLQYEPRGRPIVNWLLYTYGVPALCCVAGAWLLPRAERRRGPVPDYDYTANDRSYPSGLVGLLAVLIVFWLINLEIADYYSAGRYVEFDLSRHLARDLTRSFAWGLYALLLLGAGLWRVNRGLRLVSLGFLLLTVAKVFLYDLGQLTGLYRIVSFLALGLSLILVSLLYQRFVRRVEAPA